MSKIRVLPDQLANQIAAGEVVERPASVVKELVENAIDAGARNIEVEFAAGGRRLLRIVDDGCGMTRDDAVLAFERHATSKIRTSQDLDRIATLGFRGEALASIASVARVELLTKTADGGEGIGEGEEATRVLIEGGRMRDVSAAAHPQGTTLTVRDLFFNVPARRKFLRSEATESYHLTNIITHYALAHPEIAFALTNNGRETLRASFANDLRERAYQIFGAEFLENLLEVKSDERLRGIASVGGYVSAPRDRRTTRDAQYLFVNGRFVRDRVIARALAEGFRSVLPHGSYPAALLFLEVPYEEVDVNVHPAKTEVRFRRAAAIADLVRESVRGALAANNYLPRTNDENSSESESDLDRAQAFDVAAMRDAYQPPHLNADNNSYVDAANVASPQHNQQRITFVAPLEDENVSDTFAASRAVSQISQEQTDGRELIVEHAGDAMSVQENFSSEQVAPNLSALERHARAADKSGANEAGVASQHLSMQRLSTTTNGQATPEDQDEISLSSHASSADNLTPNADERAASVASVKYALPPFDSASGLMREASVDSLSAEMRVLGQLDDSFIIATDAEGLLLIDQHVAHERILFDKYRARESGRDFESQQLLMPQTFDLTPAQAATFNHVEAELEACGFALMRLSGRTLAIKGVPAELQQTDARNLLTEILDAVEAQERGRAREVLRDRIAASLACRAAIKIHTPLTVEKMRWLIDRLLVTNSPTTCPHGRPVVLRLRTRDLEKGFHRT